MKFVYFLKSRLRFIMFCCFGMLVNKYFIYLESHNSKSKCCYNISVVQAITVVGSYYRDSMVEFF